MRNRIFKWVYPWIPILIFVCFIGAATNYGRLILSEDPEITLANAETISNATDGTIAFDGILRASIFYVADSAIGIDSFSTNEMYDTVINPLIDFTSRTDHSIIMSGWYDTTMVGFHRATHDALGGTDTVSQLRHKIMAGGDTVVFFTPDTIASSTQRAVYWYIVIE